MTSSALFCYSIGIIGFGLRDILSRVFYSIQDTKTPMINGAIAMALNIVLNLILIKYIGHAGLALATSISALVCIVLLFNEMVWDDCLVCFLYDLPDRSDAIRGFIGHFHHVFIK